MAKKQNIIIQDLRVDPSLINVSKVAKRVGLSQSYVSQLINGHKKNITALKKVKKGIISIYGKIIQTQMSIN